VCERRFAAFKSGIEALSGALGKALPELRQGVAGTEDHDTVHIVANATLASSPDGLWDDDHMAYFYTNLPNLTSVVPSMALNNGKEPDADEAPGAEASEAQQTAVSDDAAAPESDGGDQDDKESISGGGVARAPRTCVVHAVCCCHQPVSDCFECECGAKSRASELWYCEQPCCYFVWLHVSTGVLKHTCCAVLPPPSRAPPCMSPSMCEMCRQRRRGASCGCSRGGGPRGTNRHAANT
jgi:hypothetical protein